jgi:hypothetical protein
MTNTMFGRLAVCASVRWSSPGNQQSYERHSRQNKHNVLESLADYRGAHHLLKNAMSSTGPGPDSFSPPPFNTRKSVSPFPS